MKEIILLKLGEMVLKGLNRKRFEAKFVANLHHKLADCGHFKIYALQSTVYIEALDSGSDFDRAFDLAAKEFGAVSITRAIEVEKNIEIIKETASTYLKEELNNVRSFKVESKRADKTFPMNSQEISQEVGGYLHDCFPHLRADMHHPDEVVMVEIRDRFAYIHLKAKPAAGGIPIGTGGRGLLLLSGGIDSPVAGYMIARRGVEIRTIHFVSPPYTSERAKQKVLQLAGLMQPYTGRLKVHVVPFTDIQEAIRDHCKEDYFTVIMRRFMMRIANEVAKKEKCQCLITGESLGQVASQTIEAITVTEDTANLPVLRPCIGLDKEQIVAISREIGTFEKSIEPYEDCCTVFTPRHPKTKPVLEDVVAEESKLDIDKLVAEAVEGIELLEAMTEDDC